MIAPLPAPISTGWVEVLAQTESPAFTTRRARRAEAAGAPHDPIVWARARGANVVDVDGNIYVDLTGGFGVAAAGHGQPAIVDAACRQSRDLTHALGDLQPSSVKIRLLERLQQLAPFEAKVALGLTGSDAIEVALKTAVLATGRSGVVAFEGGYHGLSYGPLAACGYASSFRTPFQSQLNPDVTFVPFPRRGESVNTALEAIDRRWPRAAPGALLIEPVQARGGVCVPPPGFLAALGDRCHERSTLVIADEIFTGFGRCGARFRSVADGLEPDLLCVGKALGGGFPISACLGRSEVMQAWGDPDGAALHTGTFFGHPVSCAAALASLDVMEQERLAERATVSGQQLMAALAPLTEQRGVREVRGAGLLVGVVFDEGRRALRLVRQLLERGYLVLPAGPKGNVLQLAPPLIIPWDLLHGFVDTLTSLLKKRAGAQRSHVLSGTEPMTLAVAGLSEHGSLRERIEALIATLSNGGRDDAARDALLAEVIRHQAQHVGPYRRWLDTRPTGADPLDWPGLPTDAFRYARVASFPALELRREFLTSGTTQGTRGRHAFRDLRLYDQAARSAAAHALFFDGKRQLIVLGPSERAAPDSSLTYMLSRFDAWFGIGSAIYAWHDGRVDPLALQHAVRDATTPVALLGTSFAWVHVLEALATRLRTPEGSWVMQTGGFKGRSREVAPTRLRREIAERLAMPESSVVSEYGMTELSSQLYELTRRSSAAPRRYWIPGWVRTTVVDAETLSPVPEGSVGLLRIDDLANLDSVAAIQTSDLARVIEGTVELVGRTPDAPLRGCSLAVEEALTR